MYGIIEQNLTSPFFLFRFCLNQGTGQNEILRFKYTNLKDSLWLWGGGIVWFWGGVFFTYFKKTSYTML